MKRQAIGIRSNDGSEKNEVNESKKMKLLHNEASKECYEMDSEKSVMDSINENSHCHNAEHLPTFSKNGPSSNQNTPDVSREKNDIDHNTSEVKENGTSENELGTHDHCNGSHDGVIIKATSSETVTASELHHSNSFENSSVVHLDEKELSEDKELMPPSLNQETLNSESTDSFQSEGFEANNCIPELDKEFSAPCSSQPQSNDTDTNSVELDAQKSGIDLDNLLMSHVKVTELPGHSDIIYSVAADDDLVLSASGDTTVKVWSVDRQSTISTFSGHTDSVTSLLLLNESQSKILKKKMSLAKISRIAITGSHDCHIKLWSVLEGKELASVYTFNGISCLGYLDSECLVVVGTEGGKLELWDMSSSKAIMSIHAHEDLVSDIKVKDNYIYSVSVDGTVKVWVYEDDDIYPLYTRKRKEISPDKKGFTPTQWKTVAVSDNIMYLGDNSSNIKVLDWRSGRLRLFKNQNEDQGLSECVTVENDMLFSTYYDSSSDIGGINVWKIPEMTYICTLTGAIADICSIAVVQRGNNLRIISGSHGLHVWDFDLSKPPTNCQEEYCVKELETLGLEIDEKSVDVNAESLNKCNSSIPEKNSSGNQWCNVM